MFKQGTIETNARFSDLYVDYHYKLNFSSDVRMTEADLQQVINYARAIHNECKLRSELYQDVINFAPKSFKDV
jgi:hypothetical protein